MAMKTNKRNLGKVVKFETIRQLKKPSFWISLLLMPLFIVVIVFISSMDSMNATNIIEGGSDITGKTLGITDAAGYITQEEGKENVILNIPEGENIEFKIIATRDEGISAVKSGDLDLYYYIPTDFSTSLNIELYTRSSGDSISLFENFEPPIRQLLAGVAYSRTDPTDAIILSNQFNISTVTFNFDGVEDNVLGRAIIPVIILAAFYMLICIFGNRLLLSVVEEKENRISEMLLTSLNTRTLIIGKLIAVITLGFIQLAILSIPIICLIIINAANPAVNEFLSIIVIDPYIIITNLLLLILSYFLFAGLCMYVGTLVSTARDASNYMGVLIMLIIFPIFFISSFMSSTPNNMVYFMSYFPPSAPIALMIRNAMGTLPWYELIAGIAVLCVASVFVIRWAIKSFENNALNFNKVSFKSFFSSSTRTKWK
jgi:ABC-2 type transport system permease protein